MFINVIIAESIASNICIPMADSCWGLTEKKQNSVKQLSFNKNKQIFKKSKEIAFRNCGLELSKM